jgi:site-specific DNA recombinase
MVTYKKKVIGYVRVSTEEQVKHGTSIETQIERITAYCVAMNWELIEIVIEPGESGGSMEKRPKFQAMRERIGKGEFDAILAVKLDRITRNMYDLVRFFNEDLKANDCHLILMDEGINTDSEGGKLLIYFMGIIAELERDRIRDRTMGGITYRAKQGKHASGNVPTGYKSVEIDGKKELVIDKDSDGIEIVKTIFRLREQEKMTYKDIAAYLNAKEYRPKNWKPERPSRFHDSSVRLIYNNPKYKGIYTFNRRGEDKIVVENEDLRILN